MSGALRHIVCFKFKGATTAELKEQFIREGQQLQSAISDLNFKVELTTSITTDRTKGYTHFLYSEFRNEADLQKYAQHPAHVNFVGKFKEHFEDVMAFDLLVPF